MANIVAKDRPASDVRPRAKRIFLGLATGAVGIVVMAFTMGAVLPGQSALHWWPTMAFANADAASDLLESGSTDQTNIAKGKAKAIAALRSSPINVQAVRSLGLAAAFENDETTADRAFRYALDLSRRDVPTHMWFIEQAVERDDIDGALRHYDQAMTTSIASRQTLVPILVQATTTPAIADRLILMLRRKPNWWGDFTHQLIGTTPNPASLYKFALGLRLRSTDTEHPDFLPRIVQRLVTAEEIDKAFRLYRVETGTQGAAVHNGSFEQDDALPPIDWQYADEPDLAGVKQDRPDGKGKAMFVVAQTGRGGVVAQQLLRLPPGRYRIGMTIGDISNRNAPERPRMTVRCESVDRRALATIGLPPAPIEGRRFETDLLLSPGTCQIQRLSILAVGALTQTGDTTPWIDDISITATPQ